MKAFPAALLLLMTGALLGAGAQWLAGRASGNEIARKLQAAEARAAAAEAKGATSEAEKAQLAKALADERERIAAFETKAREDEARREAKRQANAAAKQVTRANEIAGAKTAPGTDDAWIASTQDPAVMRRMSEQARLQTNRHYGSWLAQLPLSPEQKEQLVKLLADKRQAPADVAAASFARGSDPRDDPEGYVDLIAATRADLEQQIHTLLGDAGYQSYQDFDHSAGQTQVIGQLNQLLADIRQPLTDEQGRQLQAAMQANNTGRVSGQVVKDAASFLTPEQLQALRDLRAIQQANSRKRNAPVQALPTVPGGG